MENIVAVQREAKNNLFYVFCVKCKECSKILAQSKPMLGKEMKERIAYFAEFGNWFAQKCEHQISLMNTSWEVVTKQDL